MECEHGRYLEQPTICETCNRPFTHFETVWESHLVEMYDEDGNFEAYKCTHCDKIISLTGYQKDLYKEHLKH